MIHIDKNEIVAILEEVTFIKEPKVPFPQADTFTRIICICENLFMFLHRQNDTAILLR